MLFEIQKSKVDDQLTEGGNNGAAKKIGKWISNVAELKFSGVFEQIWMQ